MRHIALIFIALVCASYSESKEDLRDKICDLQNQVSDFRNNYPKRMKELKNLKKSLVTFSLMLQTQKARWTIYTPMEIVWVI